MRAGIGQLLTGVHSPQPRQNLLQAAGNVGQASGELLQQIGESDTDPHFQVSDFCHPFLEVISDPESSSYSWYYKLTSQSRSEPLFAGDDTGNLQSLFGGMRIQNP